MVVRLPRTQAYTAMHELLNHPRTQLLRNGRSEV